MTVGHGAIVHNATVRDRALLGMGCIVSDWAVVGEWAVVAEGAVLKQRQEIPNNRIAVGAPARLLDKQVADDFKAQWTEFKQLYANLAQRYATGLTELALQRKVASYASPYLPDFDAAFSQLLQGCFPMAGLGGGVVVSRIADLPCGILQQAFTSDPSQRPSSTPSGQGIANLVERQAFDGVCPTIVVGISGGKKRPPLIRYVPRQSTVLASCSDTGGSPG